ncbi:ABC transporter ATP-binding protein [Peribacillus cavernae]|uniref:ABC transporter ATP-binding protein n=1 Tax=Peribacillus cavernae TaxID=1674310 RepID=A0A433HK90_9BACI|nr:ABC transporter ATP-binding protein [Peribacillus cavernae]MDQ0219131.1 ATP-binding cassette subfamily B protein [Peribacillus cavernae]RUQ28639.1 ABC transporter ATP-binding protein [Peribacillus cavernae]
MKKIFSFLKPYRLPMTVALFLMLFELGVELIQPILMAKIIDEGIIKKDLSTVYLWGGVMVGISILAFVGGIVNSFASSHVSQSFGYDVRKSLFEKVQAFSYANLDQIPTSSLVTRMTTDVTIIQNTVFMGLRVMMRAPLLIIGGTIMALVVNVTLALVLLFSIPVLLFFLVWIMGKAGKRFKAVQERLDQVNIVMRENLMGMRLIKAFLRKDFEINRFQDVNEQLKRKTVSSLRLIETTMPILLLVMNISTIFILWFGNRYIAAGDIKVGEVVAIVNYATRITASFSVFSWLIMVFSRARASSQRINEVFDTEINLLDSENMDTSTGIKAGKVEFRTVSFQYPDTETSVLQNVSFIVEPGETVAILGAAGSGKTSLFQLIPRLYDPNKGEVMIDGQDVKTIKLASLRNQIGVVPQEAHLFTGSVRENIIWGKENAKNDEIIRAAERAQIHDTIMKFPKQYDTVLGQKGVNLSGGQKQRLSIARALVREPRILLLDDSTSALDLHTEAKLLHALKEYTRTTLIITQKISTAIEADSILLMEDGRLIAKGSHAQLLGNNVLYQRIYQSQFGEEAY